MRFPKSILLSALLFAAVTVAPGEASTIGFTANISSRTVVDNLSSQIAVGSLVWAGTFANEAFSMTAGTIAANVASIAIDGGWTQFAGTSSTLGITNNPGSSKIGGSVTDNTAAATAFDGHNLYLWVFNAPTVAAATQMGIFRATSVSTPSTTSWVFPTNLNGVGDTRTLSTTNGLATIAAIGLGGGIGSVSSTNLGLAAPPTAVPEPSSFAAGAILSMAAMAVRRRRRG